MPDLGASLPKLQESRFLAFDRRMKTPEQLLLVAYKTAYKETIDEMATLYAKVGLKTPVDGVSIRKEDAIRYNQLDNRLKNIADEMAGLRKMGVKLTEETSAQAIQDAYYGNQWAFEQAVQAPLKIPALPVAAIRASVYSDVSGLDLVSTWAKNTTTGVYSTQAAIMRGITQGYSYAKMASAIKGEFDKGLWQAMRVVRTEAGRCWSEGAEAAHQAAVEAGLNVRKRWSAALDQRTRLDHANLDGTYADDEGLFHIGGLSAPQPREFGDPAQDISCRCNAYDVLDGIEPSVRRIRDDYTDPKSGSSIQSYQTFEQWATPKGWTKDAGWPKIQSTPQQKVAAKTEIPIKQKAVKLTAKDKVRKQEPWEKEHQPGGYQIPKPKPVNDEKFGSMEYWEKQAGIKSPEFGSEEYWRRRLNEGFLRKGK
jgi:hypothetical protein